MRVWGHSAAIAGLLAGILLVACGGGEEPAEPPGLGPLAYASQLADVTGAIVPVTEGIVDSDDGAASEEAAEALADLSEVAGALAEEIAAELDADAGMPLAEAGTCFSDALRLLRSAISTPEDGDRLDRAGSRFGRCFERLQQAVVGLRVEEGADADAVAARVSAQAEEIAELLARLAAGQPEPEALDQAPEPERVEPPTRAHEGYRQPSDQAPAEPEAYEPEPEPDPYTEP